MLGYVSGLFLFLLAFSSDVWMVMGFGLLQGTRWGAGEADRTSALPHSLLPALLSDSLGHSAMTALSSLEVQQALHESSL